jgi:dienelactone hydrolase
MAAELRPFSCDHDGSRLNGLIALPEGDGPFAAVLVMHNALGMGAQVKSVALELAGFGYAAIVTDMYGEGAENFDKQAAGAAYAALLQKPDHMRARTVAWFDAAAAHPRIDPARIAAIGFCFGGQCVLELARSGADVRLVSSFHGLLKTYAPAVPGAIKGLVLAWCGMKDPYAPAEDIEALHSELENAGAEHKVSVFVDAEHAFTDPDAARLGMPGVAYNADAHRKSWAGTLAALALHIGN